MRFDAAASLSAVRKEEILIETEKQRRWWFATHPEFSSSRTGHRGDLLDRMGRLPRENPAKEAFIREMAKAGWSRAKAEERWNVYGLSENIAQGVARAMAVHGAITGARCNSSRHLPLGRWSGPGRGNWKIRRSWQMGGSASARRAIFGAPVQDVWETDHRKGRQALYRRI